MPQSDNILVIPLDVVASWQLKKREEMPDDTCWAELPSFQRGLVWSPAQIEVLWDSLMRGIPIGAFSLLPIVESNEHFKKGNESKNLEGAYWLVDGQQRSNAIAMGFKDYPTDNEAILWLDIHPDRSKRHRRKFFFYVTTPGRPWGYGISDDNEETRTSNVPTDDYRRVVIEELKRESATRNKPATWQMWPVKAKLPVPFSLLKGVFTDTNDAGFADEVLARINNDNNNWAVHLSQILSNNDEIFENELKNELKLVFDGLGRVIQANAIAMIAPDALSGDESDDGETDDKSDIAIYFDRLNRGGRPPSREDLDYSILKSVVPELSILDEYADRLMHPSRMANIAMLTYFSLNKWKAAINRKEIYKLQGDADFKAFILPQADGLRSPFKEAIDTALIWTRYEVGTNEFGLPPVLCSQLAKGMPSLFRLLLLLAFYAKRNHWQPPQSSFIVAFVTLVSWFGNEGKMNFDAVVGKIAAATSFEQIQIALQQFISRQIESGVLLIPPRLKDYETILAACAKDDPQAIRASWNPIGYNAGLNHIWYWNDIPGQSFLLYACRAFLSKVFENYDPASAVWNEDSRPWDYDHIIPQDWVQSGRGNRQGEFHDVVWKFLMSIGNIAPVPFSLNRSKHNAPPGDYLGDENSLAFVHMHDAKDQEPYFVRDWPKKLLENDKEDACAFAYMTMARWLALYMEWLRLPVVSLLSSAGNNDKKARICKVADYLKSKFSNVRITFQWGDGRDYDLGDEWDWSRPWIACGVEGIYRNNGTDVAKCFLCVMLQMDYCEVGLRKPPEEAGFNGTDQYWIPGCLAQLQLVDESKLDSAINILGSYIPGCGSDNDGKFTSDFIREQQEV